MSSAAAVESTDGPSVRSTSHDGPDRRSVGTVDQQRIAYLEDELAERDAEVDSLEAALVSSRRIGAAIGIVMTVLKVSEDAAFDTLAAISQQQRRKLRLVADDVVLTGTF